MSKGPFKVSQCANAQKLEEALNIMFSEGRVPIRHGVIANTDGAFTLVTVPTEFVESTENDFQPVDPRVMNFMKKRNNPSGDSGPSFN